MKKILISLILTVVMALGATQGTISAFAETKQKQKQNEETPIAQIANDDYVPYDYSNKAKRTADTYNNSVSETDVVNEVTQMVESVGGYVESYSSEQEYLEGTSVATENAAVYADDIREEVLQVITVMTTATGSEANGNYVDSKPVANAIVRINGVPRYTDRDGQIKVVLTKGDYVELYVEKNGYNPYIEIIEVTGEEKVVYVKKPSDDIDIYGVMLGYDGEMTNILINNYSIDKVEEPFDEEFTFTILCSVKIDYFNIYQDNKVKFSSLENRDKITSEKGNIIWRGKNFADIFEVGGDIKVEVAYAGITKKEELKLSFLEIKEIDLGGIIDSSGSGDVDVNVGDPMFGRFNITFLNQLKYTLKITPDIKKFAQKRKKGSDIISSGKASFHFEIIHDNKAMTTKIAIGFDITKEYKTKQTKQRILDSFMKSYNACRNLHNYGVIQSLSKAFNCPGLTSEPCNFRSPGNVGMEANITGTFLGYIELSDEQFTEENLLYEIQEQYIKSVGLELSLGASVEWTKNCVAMVSFVPIPYYFKVGFGFDAGVNFMWQFADDVEFFIEFVFKVFGKFGIGLGVGQVCGIDIYGRLELEFKTYLTDLNSRQLVLNYTIGLEGKLFFISFDIPIYTSQSEPIFQTGKYKEQNLAQLLSYSVRSLNNLNDYNIGDEPQIVKLGNKDIKVWVEDRTSSNDLNASTLYYSVKNGENWSDKTAVSNDNVAECSPVLNCVGDNVYLAWVKSNTIYDNQTTFGDVIESEEIYVAEFNDIDNVFGTPQKLTDDNFFDASPRFIQSKNGEVALVWQKNTANDILGTSGTNQLFMSRFVNNNWRIPECIFETEKPIIDFEVCIENGEIILSCILDGDIDLDSIEDRELYLKKESEPIQLVTGKSTSDLQVDWIKDELQLFFLQDGCIKSYKFNSDNEIEDVVVLNSITNSFRIETFDDWNVISYLDGQSDGEKKIMVSLLDSSLDTWSVPFAISDSQDIKNYSLVFTDNKFNYVISVSTRNDDGKLLYSTLYEDEYVLKYDIALEDIVILDSVKPGTNKAYCFVSNVGSFSIETVKMCVSGFEQCIELNELLQPSQSTIVEFDFFVENIDEDYMAFSVSLNQQEGNLNDNVIKVPIGFSDIRMVVDEQIYMSNQNLKLSFTNERGINDNLRIVLHKDNLKGEIIYLSDWITIEDYYEFNLELDYSNMGIKSGDTLCIELQCSNEQIEKQNHLFKVVCDNKIELDSYWYTIFEAMNIAKALSL